MTENKPKISVLAIAGFILGLISFVPLVGVLLGVLAIVLGFLSLSEIKKGQSRGKGLARAGIALGFLGILFTVAVYSALYYFSVVAKKGPFAESRLKVIRMTLTQTMGYLELYKKKYGEYPKSLKELSKTNPETFVPETDFYGTPFYYQSSPDGQSYELRSLGADKTYGTSDDVVAE